jgi:hypothetical protein
LNRIRPIVQFVDTLDESRDDALIKSLVRSRDHGVAHVDQFGSMKVKIAALYLIADKLIRLLL